MIFKMMLDSDAFEDDAGILIILKVVLDSDAFEDDAGF